jgi:general secretion pathway protein D
MRSRRIAALLVCSLSASARASLDRLGEGVHPVEPQATCEARRAHRTFNVFFQNVDVEKLVQTVADATCRTFIVPDGIKGKISIVGPEGAPGQLDADSFYAAFLAALDTNGLTVLRSGAFFRVLDKAKAGKAPIETVIDAQELHHTNEEMVTRLFKLQNAELEPLKQVLSQLVTPGADIVPYPPDILIVTELGTNLTRLERLIAQLDVAPAAEELRVLPVKFASAPDLADKLLRLLDKNRGANPKGPAPGGPLIVGDERTNKLVIVANPALFDRVRGFLAELDVPLPGDGQATVIGLKNAEAKDVAAALDPILQGGHAKPAGPNAGPAPPLFTGDVKISASEATNSLIVVANPADYRIVSRLIEELDTPRRQVFIEAAILEIDTERDSDMGVSFHNVASVPTPQGSVPLVLGTNYPGDPSSLSMSSLLSAGGILAGIQGPILTQLSNAVGVSIPQFGLVLHALQQSSDVNVISTPHLLAMDNKEAVIHVGQKVPFQTGYSPQAVQQAQTAGVTTAVSSISQLYAPITRENVELKLTVKPHIGEGDEVRLEVDEQTEEIASTDKVLGPTTSTRGAKTMIVAQDHRTVVMGGLMQDRVVDTVSKIPLLGDLPLVGNLFRSTTTKKTKLNLLLFLTPHVIRTREDFEEISRQKSEERQKLLEEFWGERGAGEPPVDFRHKAGPLAAAAAAIRREQNRPENGGKGNPGERVVTPAPSESARLN